MTAAFRVADRGCGMHPVKSQQLDVSTAPRQVAHDTHPPLVHHLVIDDECPVHGPRGHPAGFPSNVKAIGHPETDFRATEEDLLTAHETHPRPAAEVKSVDTVKEPVSRRPVRPGAQPARENHGPAHALWRTGV